MTRKASGLAERCHYGWVSLPLAQQCEFETHRLRVGPWHSLAQDASLRLAFVVSEMLTESTTRALPVTWHGDFSVERAAAWIGERDRESPTLLAIDRESGQPVGLVILFEVPIDASTIDLRIGYVFAEAASGRGLATELVAGLADWARAQNSIHTLTGGVAMTNLASAHVLIKNGFERTGDTDEGEEIYRLDVEHFNEWDCYAHSWDQDVAARAYAAEAFASLQAALTGHALTLEGASVVDFGCGTGLLTERLAPRVAMVYAVDTSTAMLDVLKAKIDRHGWSNVQATTDLPADKMLQDVIVCSSVCSFLDDYPVTVRQLVSLLRPGGLFVQWDWERDDNDPDMHGLSRAEINDALADAGLEDISLDTGFVVTASGQNMRPLMGSGRRPAIQERSAADQ